MAPGTIDPELIKLARAPTRIGVITSLGVVVLAVVLVFRLGGDRKFSGAEAPTAVTAADVIAGKVAPDSYVSLEAQPLRSHAIRALRAETGIGLRVVPVRGTGDKLWLVVGGNGWSDPSVGAYTGRLRAFADLPFAAAVRTYANEHPRPLFATAAATRAGFASNQVTGVGGEVLALADQDRVAMDVIDPNTAIIVASINTVRPSVQAWTAAFAEAGIQASPPADTPSKLTFADTVRFEVKGPDAVAATTRALEEAKLFSARVDPIQRHYETTWGALKASTAAGFNVGTATVPDADLELVGLYVAKGIPDGAYAVLTGEQPDHYWHVLPITVALAIIGLLFAWAFVRALRRDLARTATPPTA